MEGPSQIPLVETNTKEDIGWINPLHLADFRQKYFFRVYSFFTIQYGIVALVFYLFSTKNNFKETLQKKSAIAYVFLAVGFVSYGLLYIKRFNHPEKKICCGLMQVQFTIFLSIALALVGPTFNWFCFTYATLLICLSCMVISISYRFFSFEFHHYHGIRFIFYLQCCLVGLIMLIPVWSNVVQAKVKQGDVVREALDGLIWSTMVMMYFAYGTVRMANMNQYIQYRLDNFFFGAALIYTTPIISIYYKPKKN